MASILAMRLSSASGSLNVRVSVPTESYSDTYVPGFAKVPRPIISSGLPGLISG